MEQRPPSITALFERHLALGAKMAPFAGYMMPIQYRSVLEEHHAVRSGAGLFDVSHMGCIDVEGKEAAEFLEALSVNAILKKAPGRATYTLFAHPEGGTIDDLIVYRLSRERFYLIVNASRKEIDLRHLAEYAGSYHVTITARFDLSILALQGPKAPEFFPAFQGKAPMEVWEEGELRLSTTGYTGEKGGEIVGPKESIQALWDELLQKGVQPIGLGARDTLRLEKGFALYGHELSESILPTESVSKWAVKTEGREFLGKEAMLRPKRYAFGVKLKEGIAREGALVTKEGEPIGVVTSGGFSPTLKEPIALLLVDRKLSINDHVEIAIRKRTSLAYVVPLPFF